jgi:HEAT repeat protein
MRTLVIFATVFLASIAPDASHAIRRVGDRAGARLGEAIGRTAVALMRGDSSPDTAPTVGDSDFADPGDSLYRAARQALADGDYRRAAELFRRVAEQRSSSSYAATAAYYEAFSLYRSGETADLKQALMALGRAYNDGYRGPMQTDAATLHTRICSALARQGDEFCTYRIVKQADSALAPCQQADEDSDVRITALNALLQMDSERAIPILEKVLARRDACSVELRRKALFLVSQKDASRSIDILMRVARTDPESDVRQQALFWLSQVHDSRVVPLLDSIVRHDGDEKVRDKALFSLSQQHEPAATRAMRSVAESDQVPEELRARALFWIAQSHDDSSIAYLKGVFDRTTNEDLKQRALMAIAQSNHDPAWLMSVAQDEHQPQEIREKALFWAGQNGASVSQLLALLKQTRDASMREKVVFALSQRNDTAAVSAMMQIAKSGQDPELRKKAIFWLGQSSDPRAAQFLQDLVNQ